MEHAFQMGYKQGEKVFYVSPTNWQGEEIIISTVESLWGPLWKEKNNRFEEFARRPKSQAIIWQNVACMGREP
jgi:hypothetical protein